MNILKSSSLILINSVKNNLSIDFNILLLKRINTSSSFASKMVFPGGKLDNSDFNVQWNEILAQRFSPQQLASMACPKELSLYKESKSLSTMRPEIFYRICAIRETFEETGILLALDEANKPVIDNDAMIEDIKCNKWQKTVGENGEAFIDLFKSYKITPDLLTLNEWAEWLAPQYINPRFHTVFFAVFVDKELKTKINTDESTLLIWENPKEALAKYGKSRELPPPQLAELSDLSCFSSLQRVRNEASQRQKCGGYQNLQNVFQVSDGLIHLLPGDARYDFQNQQGKQCFNLSLEDFHSDSNVRRFIVKDGKFSYQSNIFNDS